MLNAIKEIYAWQKAAGNLEKPYDDLLESSFQIEEALEGISCSGQGGGLPSLAKMLNENVSYSTPIEPTHKSVSRGIVEAAYYRNASDVERLDKACDAIIFAIGSMAKLGLDHHGITKALNIVNNANKAKLGMPRDEKGKLLKPDDWEKYAPEKELQLLLDKRKDSGH